MSDKMVGIGPCAVPIYPSSAFTRLPEGIKEEDLWKLVGPTVERNISKLPLWKLLAIVYFEGLAHGYAGGEQNAAQASSSGEKPDVKPNRVSTRPKSRK